MDCMFEHCFSQLRFSNDSHQPNLVQPAVDYGASIMCGMGGYAAIPENLLGQCGAIVPRTPFTGR